jgi:hypothetical protein
MLRTLRFTILLVAALPLWPHDWLIVPGERVGPITARSTEASLRAAFGNDAVVQSAIHIDAATTAPGVEIYRGRPGESIAVLWPRKDRTLRWPLQVIPCYGPAGAECRWKTVTGVRTGLSVADLEKLNGKPFLLYPPQQHLQPWSQPWWNEGKLAGELGEDVELSFDDSEPVNSSSDTYMRSNEKTLAGRPLRITSLSVFLLSSQRTVPANDWTIVPGERFGPIPRGAAAEPLRETLGPAEVHRVLASADEGLGDIPGISIFGSHPGREVLLRRDGDLICDGYNYRECRWHIAGGIPLTTTVEALEKLNGRPFVFNGCCFDLGGVITSWEGGQLAKLQRALERARFAVGCEGDQPKRLIGDGASLRSDDPDILRLKCTVHLVNF